MPPPDRPDPSPRKPIPESLSPSEEPRTESPGVYIEEISSGSHTIAGVNTSAAAFVGPTLGGPVGGVTDAVTSFSEFQSIYGDASDISFAGPSQQKAPNYVAFASRAFFDNGGRKLYIARVSSPDGSNRAPTTAADYVRALTTLESLTDLSVVAAPGGAIAGASGIASVTPVHAALIAHVSRPGAYRIAVLDPPPSCSTSDVAALRAQANSNNAALYYPWITITNPQAPAKSRATINMPPSGFLCGIYARTDIARGVSKASANEPIIGAVGFERTLTSGENDLLNPLGVNCLRYFPGKGNLVWGARTTSSDPEWKYINLRRYFLYLEQSIDRGTQWVVFEPNGDQLWANVRRAISDFLYNEWRTGALMGSKPEEAYFVKCDRTTMTQNDLDNGRLICLIGIAAVRPAEFVIFRIGQWTADARQPNS
jgi:phage tail sheath protein FI